MAKKVLVPVMPTERFYDAVVAAADLVAEQGGMITFLFTQTRPPAEVYDHAESQSESELDVANDVDSMADDDTIEAWQTEMDGALDEARQLCEERGLREDQMATVFADGQGSPAAAIADEAAAGGYDLVVLAKGYFVQLPENPGGAEDVVDVASAVEALADDGVKLMVT